MQKLADFLIRFRLPLLLTGILLTVGAYFPARRLTFDQRIESLYAEDNAILEAYQKSKNLFGGDEFVFVAYTDPNLYSDESLAKLRDLSQRLTEVPGVVPGSVQDLASALAASKIPFVSVTEEQLKELFRGILVGSDDRTTAIVLRLVGANSPIPRSETIERIRQIARERGPGTYVVGEPVQIQESFRYVEEDGFWLWVYSSGLLILVIGTLFRNLRWTLLPVAVVVVTVIWTRAILVLSQVQLSMVSSILNSLITIIGIATVIHIAINYHENRPYSERFLAFRDAFARLTPAIFWTTATTAVGFGVLVSSEISPVQSFGVMMALGTLLVLPAIALIVPGGALVGSFQPDLRAATGEDSLNRQLAAVTHWVERYPGLLTGFSALLIGTTLLGCLFLRVETDFTKNFRESSPIVQGLNFVEANLGGAGTWEVNFAAPEELTPEFLEQVRTLADELRTLEIDGRRPLTKVVALTDGLDLIPRIPFVSFTLSARLNLLKRLEPEFITSLYNVEAGRMRLMLRALERQEAADKVRLINQVGAVTRQHFSEAETTGLFVLLAYLIESLLLDQWVSFVLAAIGILGLMAIAYRSLWIGLISLVPNIFPIVLVIGTMGWIGLPVNIATAMIASVSMGLTVDSSIHYLSGYQRARRNGLGFFAALRETHKSVGRALVFANLALIAGFLVLTASHFIPLVYFGILVSVAMVGGLIGNLILLPLLLRIGQRPDEPPTATTKPTLEREAIS